MKSPKLILLADFPEYPAEEMEARAEHYYDMIRTRRTVRDFSSRPVSRSLIEKCLLTAGSAPNGANRQPWHFVVVSDPEIKRRIREGAEAEEREFYHHRAPNDWLEALSLLGTDEHKPFLETAPFLIAIFAESYSIAKDGNRLKNYYVQESTGIATGFLISALHYCGLATLTHTPSPMGFLNDILARPANERAYLLLVVGYPADGVKVPDISRKPLSQIATFL